MEFAKKGPNGGGPPCWQANFGKAKEEVSKVYKSIRDNVRQATLEITILDPFLNLSNM